jgi:hypothetical protein
VTEAGRWIDVRPLARNAWSSSWDNCEPDSNVIEVSMQHSEKQDSPMTVTEAGRWIDVRPLKENAPSLSWDNREPISNAAHERYLHLRKNSLLIIWIEDDIHWWSQPFRLSSGEIRDSRHPAITWTRRSKFDEIAWPGTFRVLLDLEDMGRREGRLVEHMGGVEAVREVSRSYRSRKILVNGPNISNVRRNKTKQR